MPLFSSMLLAAGEAEGSWDITTASYDNISLSLSSQTSTPYSLFFKDDGTKVFVLGLFEDKVYQYNLSTPWDVSSGSYANKSLDYSAKEGTGYCCFFKSNGTKCYILGGSNIYQFALSTAWDISTATYDNKTINFGGQGITFKSDGTKIFVVKSSPSSVRQYTLSTPWDISTATYDNISLSLSSQITYPASITNSDDGKHLYITNNSGKYVYQYTLSTGWDISTGSYASKVKDFSAQESSIGGIFIKNDASKFYISGQASSKIFQYSLT